MGVNRKAYLAGKLVEFLNQTGTRQQDLADYAGIGQGLVADHIRQKSFPKIAVLLKYRDFFTRKLAREVTLYELTNDPIFRDMEQKVDAIKDGASSLSPKGREFALLYNGITDESKKELIEAMIIKAAESKAKSESQDKEDSKNKDNK